MLKLSRALLLLGSVSLMPAVHAEVASMPVKVGVLNLMEVMQSSPESKMLRDKLENEFSVRQQEIIAKQKSMSAEYEILKREEAVMSAADKQAATDKLKSEQQELQKMQYEFQQDFSHREQEETQMFLLELKDAVETLAADQNYDLVVRSDFVAYQKAGYDITDQVMEQFRDTRRAKAAK